MSDFTSQYRPQRIAELGLASARDGLTQVLKSGKIPHAFLFTGSRGTGKTSAARILAKAINCEERRKKKEKEAENNFEPCNKCDQCLSITAGTNLDVLEIDAASNRGIDDIRDLREKVRLASVRSSYKVYIIDEVHMLTTEAFNALLKTLEEPPSHVVFILCTTEPEKLPETIISRCLRFNFKRATQTEITAKLEEIAKDEKIDIGKEALKIIAKAAFGSFRDSQKILEQAAFSSEKITSQKVEEILGQTVGSSPDQLIKFLQKRETKKALGEVNRVVETGASLKVYTQRLLEMLRVLLLGKLGVVGLGEFGSNEGEVTDLLTTGEIKRLIEIFSKASLELRDSPIPQLPLELAVVEWSGDEGGKEKERRKAEKEEEGKEKKVEVSEKAESGDEGRETEMVVEVLEDQTGSQFSLDDVQSCWPDILMKVRPRNVSIEALLRSTKPVEVVGRNLTLEVFYKFHKDKLENDKCRSLVEQVMMEVLNQRVILKYVLRERPPIQEEHKQEEPVKNDEENLLKTAEQIFDGTVE